jgi:hypothetical protein
MKLRGSPFALALVFSVAGVSLVHADCAKLQALAQQHAYDMARRNSLDHAGFMRHRGPAGAAAENVAVGCDTEACARRMWMQSPAHRANMMLGGCLGGVGQRPSLLGDGDRRPWWWWRRPWWRPWR